MQGRRLLPGQIVDQRFEIIGLIGSGGMGTVYEARHRRLQRLAALKVLNPSLIGHSTARARMEREAVALAAIRHANVVEIHDVFDFEDLLVLDLEFVNGGTLAGLMRHAGKLALPDALRMMTAVLDGLAAIHAAKLVHRDMKPANVLLSDRQSPKIADLGVAHDLEGKGRTKTGARVGTPEYMSPEQIRGQAVGFQTDVYACGLMLFEMLSGGPVFDGTSEFDVMKAHIETPPDWERVSEVAPLSVKNALRRALEKDPERRWADAVAFRHALAEPAQAASGARAGTVSFSSIDTGLAREGWSPEERHAAGWEILSPDGTVLVWVPVGEYPMGSDDGEENERPSHRVSLSGYWIGKYPVTNAQFLAFLKVAGRADPASAKHLGSLPTLPVVGVSWHDANQYCTWAGLALPTEAQWEAAARGVTGRTYPWGDSPPDAETCNFEGRTNGPLAAGACRRGVGPYGTMDQAGNVWEWCSDVYDAAAYRGRGPASGDPARTGVLSSASRVVRGGSCGVGAHLVRSAYRSGCAPETRDMYLGFRCVRLV